MSRLSTNEIERYSRHILLPEIGKHGQSKLKDAKVLVVGAGGLGSPLASYLAAAGIGTIGIADFDVVSLSNLQRQILFSTDDLGWQKTEAAKKRLQALNPSIKIEIYTQNVTNDNAVDIIGNYDIVADGTDNFPTRYLVNDVCMMLDKPNVYASIFGFEGQAGVFIKNKGACYRCIFPNPPANGAVLSCNQTGVLGVLPGIMGTIQATEVIKLILGIGSSLVGRLLTYNALEMRFEEIDVYQNPDCSVCGKNPAVTKAMNYKKQCDNKAGNDEDNLVKNIGAFELKQKIEEDGDFVLLDVREKYELDICSLRSSKFIPYGDIPEMINDLPKDKDIVVFCHLGIRSKNIVEFLLKEGFNKVYNLEGGIDSYAEKCDNSLQRY